MDHDNIELLELFQDESSFEEELFKEAQRSKDKVIEKYPPYPADSADEDISVLYVYVNLEQVHTDTLPSGDPDELKLFLRKYKPQVILQIHGGEQYDYSSDDKFRNELRSRIIPNFFNQIYANHSVTTSRFLNLTKRLFCLTMANKILKNTEFIADIKDRIKESKLIIQFSHQLFTLDSSKDSILVNDLENSILNQYTLLKRSLEANKFYAIGTFLDFNECDSFLIELENEINGLFLKKLFLNDYLFLNNGEYPNKADTTYKWNSDIIIPPSAEKNFFIPDCYFYTRKGPGEVFYRNELYVPKGTSCTDKLKNSLIKTGQNIQDN